MIASVDRNSDVICFARFSTVVVYWSERHRNDQIDSGSVFTSSEWSIEIPISAALTFVVDAMASLALPVFIVRAEEEKIHKEERLRYGIKRG